jgi:predicted flavoprotein YhiN
MSLNKTIAVIGGGAAGFFSAISAAQLAPQIK